MTNARRAAVLVGGLVSFVVGVDVLRAIRPTLLLDADPSWGVPRLALWWVLAAATAGAGGAAAGVYLLWSRSRLARARPAALPLSDGGMTFWTDAAILGEAGIPSVVFGPGGAGLHGLEEHVRIDEVLACRDILAELARSYCA